MASSPIIVPTTCITTARTSMSTPNLPTREAQRLAEDAATQGELETLGPLPGRAAMGHGPRRLLARTANAWNYFPHDQARSRAYRWGEDGLLGITDRECRLCFALALWNGRDPILKERLFGLTNPAGQPRRGREGVLLLPRLHARRTPRCGPCTSIRRPLSL